MSNEIVFIVTKITKIFVIIMIIKFKLFMYLINCHIYIYVCVTSDMSALGLPTLIYTVGLFNL